MKGYFRRSSCPTLCSVKRFYRLPKGANMFLTLNDTIEASGYDEF